MRWSATETPVARPCIEGEQAVSLPLPKPRRAWREGHRDKDRVRHAVGRGLCFWSSKWAWTRCTGDGASPQKCRLVRDRPPHGRAVVLRGGYLLPSAQAMISVSRSRIMPSMAPRSVVRGPRPQGSIGGSLSDHRPSDLIRSTITWRSTASRTRRQAARSCSTSTSGSTMSRQVAGRKLKAGVVGCPPARSSRSHRATSAARSRTRAVSAWLRRIARSPAVGRRLRRWRTLPRHHPAFRR